MDNFGQMLGGGSCDECQHHTKGINCHECEDKYYRPEGILPNATEPCIGNISKQDWWNTHDLIMSKVWVCQ